MARTAYADVILQPGTGQSKRFHVPRVESWQTEQSIDNDVDSFSVEIGDVSNELIDALDRDTEIRVNLFADDATKKVQQVFSGLTDVETFVTNHMHTFEGGDVPSSILIGSDAEPGYWRHVTPKAFLTARGKRLGLTDVQIAPMAQIGRLWSDASEKEWSFWYRVARTGGCFMWSTNTGRLVVDGLAYSLTSYTYSFGDPVNGESRDRWIQVEDVSLVSNKQQRIEKAVVYGEDKKQKGIVPLSTATNPSSATISAWRRRPTTYSTLSTARTQKDLDDESALQIFESLVGAQEYTLSIRDDVMVQQNTMARVNLPDYGLVGTYYIVGVTRNAGDTMTQDVRLRENKYALDTRVPTAPSLTKQPNTATNTSPANIADGLGQFGVRWYESFVRATQEFASGPGTPGWDFSVFLGALISICSVETKFKNVRSGDVNTEWYPMPTTGDSPLTGNPVTDNPFADPGTIVNDSSTSKLNLRIQSWRAAFANNPNNPLNPLSPGDSAVGAMQLLTHSYKLDADALGWDDGSHPAGGAEYAGGRWCPDSNIRIAAKVLVQKGRDVGADPTNSGTIWAAVAAYHSRDAAGQAYAQQVKKVYDSNYGPKATAAVSQAQKVVAGSAQRSWKVSSTDTITLPDNAPNTVAKAITWAMSKRGDAYQWGGAGNPGYDCSSFVDEALVRGDPRLASVVSAPSTNGGSHGDSTFSLKDKGTVVAKSDLLPGDLVFFNGEEAGGVMEAWGHVGMFVGQGQLIHDPQSHDVVKVSGLNEDWFRDNYCGARRFFSWYQGPQ